MKKILLLMLMLFCISIYSQEISESDKNALIALYNSTNGENWNNKWDLNDSPENWYGVVTRVYFLSSGGKERHVDEVNLSGNNLTGSLPSDLGNLKSLNKLDVSNNNISGEIPKDLGNAEDLNYLYLQNNNFSGDIPTELFTLSTDPHFVEINLSHNKFTGKLPEEIGRSIPNLGDVYVSDNLLTDLPDYTYISLFRIETLDISNNNINFSVLERKPSFKKLVEVLEENVKTLNYTRQNKINNEEVLVVNEGEDATLSVTGLLSPNNTYQWYKNGVVISGETNSTLVITGVDVFDIAKYHCEIKNPNVPKLTLVRNNISLDVVLTPSDKNALVSLYNSADGKNWKDAWDLSADISTWKGVTVSSVSGRVTKLDLFNRGLKGFIPKEIGFLTELVDLKILESDENPLGSLPDELFNLVNLKKLYLHGKGFNGSISSSIKNLTNLNSLSLGEGFSGEIPSTIGELTSLTQIEFSHVNITGGFPDEIYNLTNLESLRSQSRIGGTLSPKIAKLTKLKYLYLNACQMEGSIPEELYTMTNLEYLDLGQNSFIGTISKNIGNLTNLQSLRFSLNQGLEGSIPVEIGKLTKLTNLSLQNCNLQGEIPSEIGNLRLLSDLSIGGNNFSGNIPSSFSNLKNLLLLWLNDNKLTGQIPDFFKDFTSLVNLRLEKNTFSGRLPDLTGIKDLKLDISNNNFVFEDFEDEFADYQSKITSFVYKPQANINKEKTITVKEEESVTLNVEGTKSSNNTYQWRKDGVDISGEISKSFTISKVSLSNSAIYDCVINNKIISDLTLLKEPITIVVEVRDDDNDGVKDSEDACLDTPKGETVDNKGCSSSQLDDDNDGVTNNLDQCSDTPTGETVDHKGCSSSQLDDDNDGVTNNLDQCSDTPTGETVNDKGCSSSQLDDDNDGVTNNLDQCSDTPTGETVDNKGCSPSQLDDDNDGVTNNLDQCSDTPTGETVDNKGCSSSQLDDDNDGVTNNLDQCSDTPTGETVDDKGCSSSQLDDDNDGVTNNLDQCSDTPTGETVDNKGCSSSQLDDDNDGVTNNLDKCSDTEAGSVVNEEGCAYSDLDVNANDFSIKVTSTSCPNVNNGKIEILYKGADEYTYHIKISSSTFNKEYKTSDSKEFVVDNLQPNTYKITVYNIDWPDYSYLYTIDVKATEDLKVSNKSLKNKKVTYTVSGSKRYIVTVNGKNFEYDFVDTTSREIDVPLQSGTNEISIKTDKVCQGEFKRTITNGNLSFYPVPAEGYLTISGLDNIKSTITVANLTGTIVLTKTVINKEKYTLSLENLVSGIYIVTVITKDKTTNTKIVKK